MVSPSLICVMLFVASTLLSLTHLYLSKCIALLCFIFLLFSLNYVFRDCKDGGGGVLLAFLFQEYEVQVPQQWEEPTNIGTSAWNESQMNLSTSIRRLIRKPDESICNRGSRCEVLLESYSSLKIYVIHLLTSKGQRGISTLLEYL